MFHINVQRLQHANHKTIITVRIQLVAYHLHNLYIFNRPTTTYPFPPFPLLSPLLAPVPPESCSE
jgi:hypothetical protein